MTREQRIAICSLCNNRAFSPAKGLICSVSEDVPSFEGKCESYTPDAVAIRNKELEIEESKADDLRKETVGMSKIGINNGVVAGVVVCVIAIAWFVGGLFIDRIFFYPPVLFILGIIAIVKGAKKGKKKAFQKDVLDSEL